MCLCVLRVPSFTVCVSVIACVSPCECVCLSLVCDSQCGFALTVISSSPRSLCSKHPGILSISQVHQGDFYPSDFELGYSFCLEPSFPFLAPFYSFVSALNVTNPEWIDPSQATQSKWTFSLFCYNLQTCLFSLWLLSPSIIWFVSLS